MNLNKEFLPYTGPPDLGDSRKKYMLAFLLVSVPCFFMGDSLGMRLGFEALVFIGFIIYTWDDRMSVSVIISIIDKTIVYHSVNCFGNKREVKIYLPTAIISYEYRKIRRYAKGMRLKIYAGNKNMTLREDINGYRQEQLDEIVALIGELKS